MYPSGLNPRAVAHMSSFEERVARLESTRREEFMTLTDFLVTSFIRVLEDHISDPVVRQEIRHDLAWRMRGLVSQTDDGVVSGSSEHGPTQGA